ncbi:hypothetical protein ElyMa_006079300 [Elysia marginata]|uniref:Uncharacterized protein n=1 Tax=Elysia marginata TaxID=1093978 RepID=A0AAV4GP68_9GAST|nr:hypothetical protein ElyMa_006079300 [Elysia marginata]
MRGHHILAGLTGSGAGVAGRRRKGSIGPVEIDLRAGLPVWKVMTDMKGRDMFLRKEGIGPGGKNLTTRLYIVENTPGKGVVEKANEQLKPKLSGIQREEAKYRNAILSVSPQGKEVPMKVVKSVASGSLLGMEMSLKSRPTGASGSQLMGEVLVQSLKSGSVYSGEKTADRNWHDPLCRGSTCIGYARGCKTYKVSKVVDEMGPLKGLWLCRVRSVSRERGWDFPPWVSSISRDKVRHGRGVY